MDELEELIYRAKNNNITWILNHLDGDLYLRCHNVFMYHYGRKQIYIYNYFNYDKKMTIKFLENEFGIEIKKFS